MARPTPRVHLAVLLAAAVCAGCESDNPPPAPSPGNGNGGTITGSERIGWDQEASGSTQLATFRYAIYVDGTRSVVADANCESTAGANSFPCSGRLPAMSPGSHVLEIATFTETGGFIEGPRSAPLRVTVAGATRPVVEYTPLTSGERLTTSDGVQLTAELVVEGLQDVTDAALAPDGRLLIAERGGALVVHDNVAQPFRAAANASDGELLALALDPEFGRTGHVFGIQARPGAAFRLVRYRLFENQLIERMPVVRDVSASSEASAALRFGPDGRLYAAFDDGGSRELAARLSEWSGKILRLNKDGGTPDDQPSASPVFWSGLASPGGLDWSSEGSLWMTERGADGIERIRALATGDARPRRAGQRASYALPQALGAASLAFYESDAVRQFRGDLFVAAREGGYLLRVTFDSGDRTRAVQTEKLLENRLGSVRAVVCGPDGALYVASATAVWKLALLR